jgi:hypothetical protein
MTLEEKAGLMQITSFNANALNDYINQRHIRYLILRDNLGARELAERANASQEIAERSRLGIPLVFTSNPRNHIRDNLVYEEAESCRRVFELAGHARPGGDNDVTLVRAFAEIARAEWRASGIQKLYGYQVDVATEPRWYRIQTTFGESPKLNADIARARSWVSRATRSAPSQWRKRLSTFPAMEPSTRGSIPTATGVSGRRTDARQLLQVSAAAVPGGCGSWNELDHELLQQSLEREERRAVSPGMVAVGPAAVRSRGRRV